MANNCHIQTASCMLIAVGLNDSCAIIATADTYTSAGVATVAAETERQEGTDYSATNFGGVACGPESKADTVERWLNITGELCMIDWAFQAATSGNPAVLNAGGDTIGYATLAKTNLGVCTVITKPRISLVIARKAATDDGGCSAIASVTGATGIVAHFFPMVTDFRWDISPFEDARAVRAFTATGYANPAINAGPLNLWPAAADPNAIPNEAMHAEVFVDPAALPVVDCDVPISHPAPAVRTDAGE